MNPIWTTLGRMMFWLTWPATWLYLHNSRRTRIIVMHRGQILLTKGWLSNRDWALPGGGRHRHETMLKAARRELLEETGLDLPAVSFAPSGTFAADMRGPIPGLPPGPPGGGPNPPGPPGRPPGGGGPPGGCASTMLDKVSAASARPARRPLRMPRCCDRFCILFS